MSPSLQRLGFASSGTMLRPTGSKGLPHAINLSGKPGEGKTELALSAPGLIAGVTVDRGYLNVLLNPSPPKTRNPNAFWKVIDPPLFPGAQVHGQQQSEFGQYWALIRDTSYDVCKLPEVRSVILDGDSDTWEIQRMAEFGRLSQVPSHLYVGVNAARRVYYSKLTDFRKFLIFTSKMTKEYVQVYKPNGEPEMDDKGKPKRAWSGNWERAGFDGIDYSLQLSINCYRMDAKYDKDGNLVEAGEFAARLELCKPNRNLDGTEFAGEDCNLPSILRHVYPHIPLSDWGY